MSQEFKNEKPEQCLQKWWEDLRHGNKIALDNLYSHFFKPLYNYGMHFMGGPSVIVEDCIQDFFIYLWHKRNSLSSANNVKKYIFSSFRRRLVEFANQEKANSQLSSEFSMYFSTNSENENEDIINQNKRLNQAIKQLSEQQKEALFLKIYNRLSYREIAYIMDLKPDTPGKVVVRALKKLRTLMLNSPSDVAFLNYLLFVLIA